MITNEMVGDDMQAVVITMAARDEVLRRGRLHPPDDIEFVGGIKAALFGAEGLFFA
jgi:hypothetical protein